MNFRCGNPNLHAAHFFKECGLPMDADHSKHDARGENLQACPGPTIKILCKGGRKTVSTAVFKSKYEIFDQRKSLWSKIESNDLAEVEQVAADSADDVSYREVSFKYNKSSSFFANYRFNQDTKTYMTNRGAEAEIFKNENSSPEIVVSSPCGNNDIKKHSSHNAKPACSKTPFLRCAGDF